ncbi:hypothetical protein CPter291_0891 [Collimonas pratensis]|uniref:Lipoprotein n=1 Tax=Collimonas pratensis TaxID=279113 RepID=A0ABN4M4U4_9BURK|nr:hypothetical protein CPter291_0891 [Collimonas pratensis]
MALQITDLRVINVSGNAPGVNVGSAMGGNCMAGAAGCARKPAG